MESLKILQGIKRQLMGTTELLGNPDTVPEQPKDSMELTSIQKFNNCFTASVKFQPPTSQSNFQTFLLSLGLQDKYPQQLTLPDALLVRQELLGNNRFSDGIQSLPPLILQKIMMYSDYRQLSKELSTREPKVRIHPIDSLIALLHCCDNFLRQDLLSRLATCQIAVPFLLPDPHNSTVTFLLWSMRSIVCEWKSKIGSTIKSVEARVVDYCAPIVSFLRIGKAKSPKDISKSRMLNTVIGDLQYFFHWNCAGGAFSREFVDGVVELSCYFPSGKDNDTFTDSVYFLNLRGEARDHAMQINLINRISFMSFIFLLEEDLNSNVLKTLQEFAVLQERLVVVFPDYDYVKTLKNMQNVLKFLCESKACLLDVKDKNDDDVKSEIHKLIVTKLSAANASNFSTISQCATIARNAGIKVDEDNEECQEGQRLAKDMIGEVHTVNLTDAKTEMLPLQGSSLWHKWAKLDKESYQKPANEHVTTAYYNQTVEQGKKEIRKRQYKYVSKLNPLMKCFLNCLHNSNTLVRMYFLQWSKMLLDDCSRKNLPQIRMVYEKSRSELQKINDKENHIARDLINKLKQQNKSLIEGSLGLEHLFRELGQIYEATVEHTKKEQTVEWYPKVVVDILNRGYPVELMDGDASHVPIKWVMAILNQLTKYHERKKIFVISVLGIQSTGKSTLLNTMFGLQFNVSAGRCTRGAFLQLLPVENANSKCDYILIIDTEGLRAPELSYDESFKHDNELATFVIGIADLSLVNIYGETPGDLNDILQTAVHAFIRMRNVDMQLGCHFVHQNVPSVCSDSKIKFGQQSFQDRLDKMTRAAAIAEQCEKYRSFHDVIQFNKDTDVTNFPGLWKGDPPMAPVNPGYSEKALALKSALLALVDKQEHNSSFTNFQQRVQKLWSAVCRENYIFSFKNTLEVTAYGSLDKQFSQWSWMLHRKMLEWRHEAGNTISNSPSDRIIAVADNCFNEANKVLRATCNNITVQMNEFFENSEYAETLAQWKAKYEIRLDHLKQDGINEAKKQCALFKLNQEGRLKLEQLNKNHRQQLLKQLKELVLNAKRAQRQLNQQELEKTFEGKWQRWLEDFSSKEWTQLYYSDQHIETTIGNIAQELLKAHDFILNSELARCPLKERGKLGFRIEIDKKRHISEAHMTNTTATVNSSIFHKFGAFFLNLFMEASHEEVPVKVAVQASEIFILEATNAFRNIKRNFENFDKAYAYELLIEFIKSIDNFNKKNSYFFTTEYKVDMVIIFAGYMTIEFANLMQEIRTKNDPTISLKRQKATYLNTFLAQFKDISGHEIAASNLCQLLVVAIEAAVFEILPGNIVDNMIASDASFKEKKYFKMKILKDLAKRKDFKLYKIYLEDIKGSFEWWAEQYVQEYCMENERANFKRQTKTIVHRIVVQIKDTVQRLNKGIAIKQWLYQFHKNLSKILTINLAEMQDIIEATHSANSSDFFSEALTVELNSLEAKVMNLIEEPSSKFSNITSWNKSAHLLLSDHLFGCCAQCPFCGEQCELNDADHISAGKDHYLNIHRPQCLKKYKRVINRQLVFDLCTYSVESEKRFRNRDTDDQWYPYKDYRTLYSDWCISNESPKEAPKYWQWFVSMYIEEIIHWAKSADTPIDHLGWEGVSESDAIASLSEVYKIT
ncbi:interferon-induced very large GTPase 1-like isoform X2 [Dysidea avara]